MKFTYGYCRSQMQNTINPASSTVILLNKVHNLLTEIN
jgi:hypothetical protein